MQGITKPKLGFWSATSLVMGTVVGSGIFMLPASVAAFGGIGIAGWALSGMGALFLALCFSRLSRRLPKMGGPYAYSRRAFGELIGFQVATSYWIRSAVTVAAISIGCASYMSSLMPDILSDAHARSIASIVVVALLTGVNLMGVKPVGIFLVVTTAVKVLPLLFMAFFGIFFIQFDHFTPFNVSQIPNTEALMAAAAITFFSFMGMESATIPSDDVENPGKTIPRATVFGTGCVIILYLASATAVLGVVPLDILSQSKAPFSLAAEHILGATWGPIAATLITFCAIVSCLGAINGYLLLQGKMPVAAARDGLFPKVFEKENSRGAPWFGLLTCFIGSSTLIYMTTSPSAAEQFKSVCLIASFLGLFVYAYSSISEAVIIVTDKAAYHSKDFWSAAVIGLFAFSYCVWAMAGAGPGVGFMGILFMFATLPVYVWMCWSSASARAR